MSQLALYLLGSFRTELDGEAVTAFESDKVRALLAYLAVEAKRPHRREKLVGLLWPDWPETSARQNLSHALYNLRDVIGDREAERPILSVTRQTLQFDPEGDGCVDAAAFRHLIGECVRHDHLRLEACDECAELLKEAVALYGGGFLEGFSLPDSAPFEEWARETGEELGRLALEAFGRLASARRPVGRLEDAIGYVRQPAALDPPQRGSPGATDRAAGPQRGSGRGIGAVRALPAGAMAGTGDRAGPRQPPSTTSPLPCSPAVPGQEISVIIRYSAESVVQRKET